MRCFIVRLYNDKNELLEEVEVMAKGTKTAWKSAKFKTPIKWGYWMAVRGHKGKFYLRITVHVLAMLPIFKNKCST